MKNKKEKLNSYYFTNPSDNVIERKIENVKLKYLYFKNQLSIQAEPREVINGCLLEGKGTLKIQEKSYEINKFDIFFLPPKKSSISPKFFPSRERASAFMVKSLRARSCFMLPDSTLGSWAGL